MFHLQSDLKQIQELKNSNCFSPTYEIFINWTDDSNEIYSPRSSGKYNIKFYILLEQKINNFSL